MSSDGFRIVRIPDAPISSVWLKLMAEMERELKRPPLLYFCVTCHGYIERNWDQQCPICGSALDGRVRAEEVDCS